MADQAALFTRPEVVDISGGYNGTRFGVELTNGKGEKFSFSATNEQMSRMLAHFCRLGTGWGLRNPTLLKAPDALDMEMVADPTSLSITPTPDAPGTGIMIAMFGPMLMSVRAPNTHWNMIVQALNQAAEADGAPPVPGPA